MRWGVVRNTSFILKEINGWVSLWRLRTLGAARLWQQHQQQSRQPEERGWAELSWAGVSHWTRTDNVKLESDGAGSLCGRTAASSSGIKTKNEKEIREARTGAWVFFSSYFSLSNNIHFSHMYIILPCSPCRGIGWNLVWREWRGREHRFPRFLHPPSMLVLLLFLMTLVGRSEVLHEDTASLYGIIVDERALFLR